MKALLKKLATLLPKKRKRIIITVKDMNNWRLRKLDDGTAELYLGAGQDNVVSMTEKEVIAYWHKVIIKEQKGADSG